MSDTFQSGDIVEFNDVAKTTDWWKDFAKLNQTYFIIHEKDTTSKEYKDTHYERYYLVDFSEYSITTECLRLIKRLTDKNSKDDFVNVLSL